ncbi:MAG: dephospho-CoA kinase, partial [Vulcanococcus sp.]
AREALASGSPGARAVLERYGNEVLSSAHEADAAVIDRAALGRIVFADQRERQWLEQLIHPFVRERFEEELTAQQAAPVVVLVIPLLFEAGLEHLCSEVWVVDCEPEQQLKRLMQRDGITAEDATARIAAQWPLAKKSALADRLIDNRGTPAACVSALSL